MNWKFYFFLNKISCPKHGHLTRILLFGVCLFNLLNASAKTVVIGTGSGNVSQTSMTGLSTGDTVAITPGTYSGGGTFGDLHDVTILNYGGVVTFTGTVYWSGNTMHNVKWTGTGYSGAFYGFVFNNPSSPFSGIYGSALHTDSARFDHIDFENISGSSAAVDFSNNSFAATYNGSASSFKMHCVTFSDIKVNNSALFIITGWNCPSCTGNNICDSIDMHNIIITNLQGAGDQVRGTMTHFNVYNWNITYSGYNTTVGDIGVLYLSGNGSIHHNFMHGGRGYLARIDAFSIKPFQDSVLFYDNIILSTTNYGGLDIRCDSTSTGWGAGSSYLNPIKNVYVVNNTIGNKSTDQPYVVPAVLMYNMDNHNVVYCHNNLAFAFPPISILPNDPLPGSAFLIDYNLGNGTYDSSNNRYFTAGTILGQLQDTLATCRPLSNSILNNRGNAYNFVTTDYSLRARPNPPSIGAQEYSATASNVTANAGNNQTITLPVNSVNLSGSGSTVINATISSYQWSETSGPGAASLSSPSAVNTNATGLIAGIYVFSLKVKDTNNDSSTATVTITVNPANQPPVVNAGSNQTISLPASSVTLTGSATDASGTITEYLWTQLSGPNTSTITSANASTTSVTGLIAGTYQFQLKVTDNNNLSGTATVNIIVNPANQPPVVNAGSNQTITLPASSVTLTGSATDASGTITGYLWTQLSGPNTSTITSANASTTSVIGLIAGTYQFQLKATDNNNLSGTATVSITVNPANRPPVANAGADTTINLPSNTVILNGSKSTAASGNITSYAWALISGPNNPAFTSPTAAITNVNGLVAGIYIFQLTVTDNNGAIATATVNVTVLSEVTLAATPSILIYPNPASSSLNLQITSDATGIMIVYFYDMLGNVVMEKQYSKASSFFSTPINISVLNGGTYVLQAIVAKYTVLVAKFVKQ